MQSFGTRASLRSSWKHLILDVLKFLVASFSFLSLHFESSTQRAQGFGQDGAHMSLRKGFTRMHAIIECWEHSSLGKGVLDEESIERGSFMKRCFSLFIGPRMRKEKGLNQSRHVLISIVYHKESTVYFFVLRVQLFSREKSQSLTPKLMQYNAVSCCPPLFERRDVSSRNSRGSKVGRHVQIIHTQSTHNARPSTQMHQGGSCRRGMFTSDGCHQVEQCCCRSNRLGLRHRHDHGHHPSRDRRRHLHRRRSEPSRPGVDR